MGANAFQKLLDYDLFINDDLNTIVRLSAEQRRQEEDLQRRLVARRERILSSAGQAAAVVEEALRNLPPLPRSQEMNTNTIPSIPPPPERGLQVEDEFHGVPVPPGRQILCPAPEKVRLSLSRVPGFYKSRATATASHHDDDESHEMEEEPSPGPSDESVSLMPSGSQPPVDLETLLSDDGGEEEPLIVAVEGPLTTPKGKGPWVKHTSKKLC